MPFGSLEPPPGHNHVPGTVKLLQQDRKHIELNPRPSDTPNDPLRWSMWKKFALFFTISFGSALCGIDISIFAVAINPISKELQLPVVKVEPVSGYPFLSTAVGCAISAVFARTIGKRPVLLVAAVLHLVGTIWTSVATSYGSLVGARIISGLGAGTFEPMGLATAGDIFFVHQRGRAMSFNTFMSTGCTQLAPVLAGYMVETYGWRSVFQALIAFKALLLLLVFIAVPETAFNRQAKFETDIGYSSSDTDPQIKDQGSYPNGGINTDDPNKPRPYLKELLPYRRIHSGVNLWTACGQFFVIGLYPIVWYAFVLQGTYLAWFAGIQVTLAQVFGVPPINFGPTQIGFLNTFGIVGALFAEVFLHVFADRSCTWLSKLNRSIYEPEFRLLMVIPAVVIHLIGYPLYGWYTGTVASEREISWVAASVLFALAVFSLIEAQSTASAYVLDAHRDVCIEAGLFAVMLRSFLSYGATVFMPTWVEEAGSATVFYIIAGMQTGIIVVSTGLMWIFGKKVRLFLSKHNPIRQTQKVLEKSH